MTPEQIYIPVLTRAGRHRHWACTDRPAWTMCDLVSDLMRTRAELVVANGYQRYKTCATCRRRLP